MKISPLFMAILAVPAVMADDWPQWMGRDRDGVWHEEGIVDRFPESGPALRWKQKIGSGYSGPAVAGGFVYLMDRISVKVEGQAKYLHEGKVPENKNFVRQLLPGKERIVCLRESDGEIQWVYEYDCPYSTVSTYAIGPRATPTVADGHVYAVGAEGHLTCLDARTGRLVWRADYQLPLDGASQPLDGLVPTAEAFEQLAQRLGVRKRLDRIEPILSRAAFQRTILRHDDSHTPKNTTQIC